MAPKPQKPPLDPSSAPLADFFFISGIESSQVYDERIQPPGVVSPLASPPVDETIEEDCALETESLRPTSQDGLANHANGDSTRQRPAFQSDSRHSSGTIVVPDFKPSPSNRSSTQTIKGVLVGGSGLNDVDFENALRKFATERDSFLEEIQFTAGVVQHNRPTPTRPRPRPPRVPQPNYSNTNNINNNLTTAINKEGVGNLSSGVGSIRRRLSTMQSSLKRQPSTARQCKWRGVW